MVSLSSEVRYQQTPMLRYCNDVIYKPLLKTRILFLDTETTDLPPKTVYLDLPDDDNDDENWTPEEEKIYQDAHDEFCKKLYGLRAVQIYFKLVENGEVIDTFGTLLSIPDDVDISEGSFNAHGISRDDLEGAPSFKDCVPRIRELLKNTDCICAYNSDFDRMILNKEIHKVVAGDQKGFYEDFFMDEDYMIRPWLDPLVWRRHSKIVRNDRNPFNQNKLDQAAKFYGVSAIAQVKHKKVSLHNAETDVNILIELTRKMYESGDIPFDFGDCFLSQDKAAKKYYEYRDK